MSWLGKGWAYRKRSEPEVQGIYVSRAHAAQPHTLLHAAVNVVGGNMVSPLGETKPAESYQIGHK